MIQQITDIASNIDNVIYINELLEDQLIEVLELIYIHKCNNLCLKNEYIMYKYLLKQGLLDINNNI